MEEKQDFYKALRYFFVCYADFECSNIPVQDPGSKKTKILMKQIPNSFMVFCPDPMLLDDKKSLSVDSYLKKFHSDDHYEVVKEFIRALDTIRTSCVFRFQSHPRVPKLTKRNKRNFEWPKYVKNARNRLIRRLVRKFGIIVI
jgi:hypothetical protein